MTVSWAYLAGFLDGDGWITSSKNRNSKTRRFVIGFTQKSTHAVFMQKICAFLDAQDVRYTYKTRIVRSPRVPTSVEMVNIHIKEQVSVVKAVTELHPHLVLKKDKALACLTYTTDRLVLRGHFSDPPLVQDKRKYWTTREIETLHDMHTQGHGNRSIAGKLSRSADSVSHKLYRLGLTRNDLGENRQ